MRVLFSLFLFLAVVSGTCTLYSRIQYSVYETNGFTTVLYPESTNMTVVYDPYEGQMNFGLIGYAAQ